MMDARKAILCLGLLIVLLAVAVPAASQQGDDIVVNGADEVKEVSFSMAQDLLDSIAGVGPRIVLQHANQSLSIELVAVPGPLQTLLDQISARVVVQYANAIRRNDLLAVPGPLQTLLGQVSDRIAFQYANGNRKMGLSYPAALIGDTVSPQISNVIASPVTASTELVAWITDEFANSVVIYGEQPGAYPHTAIDALYVKAHALTLTGLTSRATYYYRVRSTDPSGNTSESSEYSCVANPPQPPPAVYGITPNEGFTHRTVHVTNLAGSHFQAGAAVRLTRTGQPDIHASNVVVVGESQITCDLNLAGAIPGSRDVVVTNPDALSGQLTNGFTVKVAIYLPLTLKRR